IMKLTTLLMIIGTLQLHASAFSQTINLTERNVSLESVISQIEHQSGYNFFSKAELLNAMPKVHVNLKNATLEEALEKLFDKLPISYSIIGKNVVISMKANAPVNFSNPEPAPILVFGIILDEVGKPMPGVNVKVKNKEQI